ncbi:MAG: PQQ-dependent sugar dehydrogenase, partial [Pseudomonadales bacterium]|nr:PQQ-dependent sugar dehydrogenase [Pseudomonadales bacterium]
MNSVLKFFLYVLIILVVLVGGLYVAYRVFVGAVNVPMGDYELDTGALAQRIELPDGFSMGLYGVVPNARLMRFTDAGDLLVAIPNENRIVLLERDADGDGKADGQRVLLNQLNSPNGMDFHDGYLYVAESDSIARVRFDHDNGRLDGEYTKIVTGLPAGGNHWKKTLRFGPDGMMYVTVGSSCNVCIEEDERRGTMLRYAPDGSGEEIYARGLRNATGMDWAPFNGALYATDNGRDLLGDNFPPCELNRIVEGGHYGWPYANGDKIPDPDFGEGNEEIVENSIAPVYEFPAHNT